MSRSCEVLYDLNGPILSNLNFLSFPPCNCNRHFGKHDSMENVVLHSLVMSRLSIGIIANFSPKFFGGALSICIYFINS